MCRNTPESGAFMRLSFVPAVWQFLAPGAPTLWARLRLRLRCTHRHAVQCDAYQEEQRGHYDEYICTRQVTVYRCWVCGKRWRVRRMLPEET
jgi:hypothetical protein